MPQSVLLVKVFTTDFLNQSLVSPPVLWKCNYKLVDNPFKFKIILTSIVGVKGPMTNIPVIEKMSKINKTEQQNMFDRIKTALIQNCSLNALNNI